MNFKRDRRYLRRFFYEVLIFTLPICGFSKPDLPPTKCKRNVYNRKNLLKIACARTLRMALAMRDRWLMMFESQCNNSGFIEPGIKRFLFKMMVWCIPKEERKTSLDIYLALSNEIIMFLYNVGANIDFNKVINSICDHVLLHSEYKNLNISEEIEKTFEIFNGLSSYNHWITNFIADFAVPYGCDDSISDLFFNESIRLFNDVIGKPGVLDDNVLEKVRTHLGFLPHELYSEMAFSNSVDLAEKLAVVSLSILPGDRESPEPPPLPSN